jgi:hypothetical protein
LPQAKNQRPKHLNLNGTQGNYFTTMGKYRSEYELPEAVQEWGWIFHHLGIPTEEKMPGEKYLPRFKFYVSGYPTSPFGIEWMRFEADSPMSRLIRTVPHLAFVVDDLDHELAHRGLTLITTPDSPTTGIRVAMVEHNGAPIELMEYVR